MPVSKDTREMILDAAWRLFNRVRSDGLPTVAEIAAEAGVSRQAVYLHFQNRATLLIETILRQDRNSGFSDRIAETRELEPLDGLVAYIRNWFDYVAEVQVVARLLMAADAAGEEGGEAWRDRMGALRRGVGLAIERIDEAGMLPHDWTAERAADWTWSRIHFTVWYHLVIECNWDKDDLLDHTISSLLSDLTKSPA